MRHIRLSLICLLILAISAACTSGLAEEEDAIMPVEFYYTPGEPCVVYEEPWGTISLNEEQPARIYAEGYDLGFTVANREDKAVLVVLYNFNLNGEIFSHQTRDVEVPANSSVDCAVPILPDTFVQDALKEGFDFDPEEVDRIRSFDGLETLGFMLDARYVEPVNDNYIYPSISYTGLIHLQH